MATRIETFAVLVPLQTLQTATATTALDFPEGQVDEIEILVPPGPSGLVGFRVLHSGEQVIPITPGEFLITDNEKIDWPLVNFPVGHAWAVEAFNEDRYDHTLFFRFLITDVTPPTPALVAEVPVVQAEAPPEQVDEVEALPEPSTEEVEELARRERSPATVFVGSPSLESVAVVSEGEG